MASSFAKTTPSGQPEAPTSQEQGRNTGPLGTGEHVVQEGECLLSIAHQHGLFWKKVWDLPANAELQRARKDPGQLLVGDRIIIPERETRDVSAEVDKRHEFIKLGVPAKLRLVVEYEDEPISNSEYVLLVDGSLYTGKTDDQGLLEASIPPDASHGDLQINGLHFDLSLGALDPSSEDIGIQQRLANLGFYNGELDGQIGPHTRKAIAAFQERTGLSATGELDDTTLGKLLQRHDETHERLPQRSSDDGPSRSTEGQHG